MISNCYVKHVRRIVVGITVLAFLLTGAGAEILTVCSGGCSYSDIQAAINSGNNGDIILVSNGTYHEHVLVNKSVSLHGESNLVSIIDGGGNGTVVKVTVSGAKIENFRIQNGSTGLEVGSDNNTVSSNVITNITGKSGISNEQTGQVGEAGGDSYGINVSRRSSNNSFTGNVIGSIVGGNGGDGGGGGGDGGNAYGIFLALNSGGSITGNKINTIAGGTGGIENGGGSGGNGGNSYGIYISGYSGNSVLSGNNIYNNAGGPGGMGYSYLGGTGGSSYGIYLNGSSGINLNLNNINNLNGGNGGNAERFGGDGGGSYGMYISGSSNISFSRISISNLIGADAGWTDRNGGNGGNAYGIYLSGPSGNRLLDIIIINITAGSASAGSLITAGDGGSSYGIYLNGTSGNNLTGSSISKIVGGSGGTSESGSGAAGRGIGVYLTASNYNRIYNNFFNNTYNIGFGSMDRNTWNTTKVSGTNVIGGPYLGGNFWAYPNGTGFSQKCSDGNRDGICDLMYKQNDQNIDFLPLAAQNNRPAAYWKFDESTGSTASDYSGNNNTGTISGAAWTAGRRGNALVFDGVNDYVDAGNKASLQITGAISMEGWVKINELSVSSSLFGRGHGLGTESNYGYFLTYYAARQALFFDTYSTTKRDNFFQNYAITDNNWHHIAVTWDGTTSSNSKKMYVDGVLIAQKTSDISYMGNPSYNFKIGIDSVNYRPAKATIDEVKVYNRALSASEIQEDYIAGISSITVLSPNGGQIWPAGTAQTIRWNYTGNPGSRVKIELLKNGAFNRMINSSVPAGSGGSGSYRWIINASQAPGTYYKIRVTSTTNAAYTDSSNNNFTISGGITVRSPNGGEIWQRGTVKNIRWNYTGSPGSYVKIELMKGGSLNRTIVSSTSLGSNGSGSYNWLINLTQVPGSDYKVRVRSTSSAAYTDVSNNNFNISGT